MENIYDLVGNNIRYNVDTITIAINNDYLYDNSLSQKHIQNIRQNCNYMQMSIKLNTKVIFHILGKFLLVSCFQRSTFQMIFKRNH